MENASSEQELLALLKDGKISEDEYNQLLEAMRKSAPGGSRRPRYLARRYLFWSSVVAVVIIADAILIPIAFSRKSKEHKHLTISKAYWFHSDDRPRGIPEDAVQTCNDGHLLFHVDEWFEDMGIGVQYRPFLDKADQRFILKARGYLDVHANAERGVWNQEFYVRIPEKEYVKMEADVAYAIHPLNSNPKYQWKVAPGVTIRKSGQ